MFNIGNTQKVLVIIVFSILITLACKHGKSDDDITPKPADTTHVFVNTNAIDSVCFDEQILPLLVSNCAKSGCHDTVTKQSGIVVTSYDYLKTTLSGTLLMQSLRDSGQLGMPISNKLTADQVKLIQTWVNQGMKRGIDCQGPCDTSNVTYSGSVFPIIQNYCLGCHISSGTLLTNYTQVKAKVTDSKLFCTVSWVGGCQPMPQGGVQLSQCNIRKIKIWIDAGAQNN